MKATLSIERQRAREVAEAYRHKGYEVVEAPAPEHLPAFLAGYHPDLLLRKGEEAIVVAVKSRASLAHDTHVRELARLLRTKPRWHFELIVVGEAERVRPPAGTHPFDRTDILRGLEAAERLRHAGFADAALLPAWAAAEATVRLLTDEEGLVLEQSESLALLKHAAMHGVISREEYHFFTQVMAYRNALSHGFQPRDFEPELVTELISMTQHLLPSAPTP